jgi:hypothetical protein
MPPDHSPLAIAKGWLWACIRMAESPPWPRGLRGKKVGEVHKHFRRMKNAPTEKRKRYETKVAKQAKAWNIPVAMYKQVEEEVWKEKKAAHEAREEAKKAARSKLGVTAGDVRTCPVGNQRNSISRSMST